MKTILLVAIPLFGAVVSGRADVVEEALRSTPAGATDLVPRMPSMQYKPSADAEPRAKITYGFWHPVESAKEEKKDDSLFTAAPRITVPSISDVLIEPE